MLNTELVKVKNLSFSRGERIIFDDISLEVPQGKITAIMGPSGIGKTTLLRLIGGQLPPDEGEIWFDGDNIPALPRRKLYQARKKMSMLFQSGALFTDLNVFDNVAFPLREHTELNEKFIPHQHFFTTNWQLICRVTSLLSSNKSKLAVNSPFFINF